MKGMGFIGDMVIFGSDGVGLGLFFDNERKFSTHQSYDYKLLEG